MQAMLLSTSLGQSVKFRLISLHFKINVQTNVPVEVVYLTPSQTACLFQVFCAFSPPIVTDPSTFVVPLLSTICTFSSKSLRVPAFHSRYLGILKFRYSQHGSTCTIPLRCGGLRIRSLEPYSLQLRQDRLPIWKACFSRVLRTMVSYFTNSISRSVSDLSTRKVWSL